MAKKSLFSFLIAVLCLTSFDCAFGQYKWERLLDKPTFGIAVNPKNPHTVFAGGWGRRLYRSYDAGKSWDTIIVEFETGTTRFTNVLVHPEDTAVVIVAGIGFGTVRRSTDHGMTWTVVLETLSPIFIPGETIYCDPNNSDIVYAGELRSRIIYRSKDKGVSWDSIGRVSDTYDLCTTALRPDSANIMLAGCTGGKIFKSADSGKTWRQTAELANNEFGDSEIPRIIFSKKDPLRGYAVVTYFYYVNRPNGGLFETLDGGESWSQIGFADTSLWALDIVPTADREKIVVGGYTDNYASPVIIEGQGIVSEAYADEKDRWKRSVGIEWSEPTRQNVWMIRNTYDSTLGVRRIYMATEQGFFAANDGVVSVDDLQENHQFAASLAMSRDRFMQFAIHRGGKFYSLFGEMVFDAENIDAMHKQATIFPPGVYFSVAKSLSSKFPQKILLY